MKYDRRIRRRREKEPFRADEKEANMRAFLLHLNRSYSEILIFFSLRIKKLISGKLLGREVTLANEQNVSIDKNKINLLFALV